MANSAEDENGSGFLRAIDKLKGPVKAASRIVKPSIEPENEPGSGNEATSRTHQSHAAARSKLRSNSEARHDGLELWPLPGLAPMTRVRTSFGDVHSIALRKGDKVLLKSGEYKAIEWINRIMLDEHILALKPDSNPILLAAGSLGPGTPSCEMMVSPRQVFCADERSGLNKPREASMLVSRTGVRRYRESGLTYTMFHVGEAAEVYCEGLFLNFPVDA